MIMAGRPAMLCTSSRTRGRLATAFRSHGNSNTTASAVQQPPQPRMLATVAVCSTTATGTAALNTLQAQQSNRLKAKYDRVVRLQDDLRKQSLSIGSKRFTCNQHTLPGPVPAAQIEQLISESPSLHNLWTLLRKYEAQLEDTHLLAAWVHLGELMGRYTDMKVRDAPQLVRRIVQLLMKPEQLCKASVQTIVAAFQVAQNQTPNRFRRIMSKLHEPLLMHLVSDQGRKLEAQNLQRLVRNLAITFGDWHKLRGMDDYEPFDDGLFQWSEMELEFDLSKAVLQEVLQIVRQNCSSGHYQDALIADWLGLLDVFCQFDVHDAWLCDTVCQLVQSTTAPAASALSSEQWVRIMVALCGLEHYNAAFYDFAVHAFLEALKANPGSPDAFDQCCSMLYVLAWMGHQSQDAECVADLVVSEILNALPHAAHPVVPASHALWAMAALGLLECHTDAVRALIHGINLGQDGSDTGVDFVDLLHVDALLGRGGLPVSGIRKDFLYHANELLKCYTSDSRLVRAGWLDGDDVLSEVLQRRQYAVQYELTVEQKFNRPMGLWGWPYKMIHTMILGSPEHGGAVVVRADHTTARNDMAHRLGKYAVWDTFLEQQQRHWYGHVVSLGPVESQLLADCGDDKVAQDTLMERWLSKQ